MLYWKNLNANFDKDSKKYFELKILNTSFVLFDLTSSQRLHFKCSQGSFYFGEGFESMTLIKSNGIRFKEIDCLYLPLEPILEIKWQEFSSIPSWSEYRKLITNKRIFTSSQELNRLIYKTTWQILRLHLQ